MFPKPSKPTLLQPHLDAFQLHQLAIELDQNSEESCTGGSFTGGDIIITKFNHPSNTVNSSTYYRIRSIPTLM
ncbi:hypothetical protein NIES2119_06325 [[Phormidium ambiguum] IAM M-71]|uniref:Uncharacterized protein n=1 Tax=[Phormidium ambiguum] IAM M-71 TaxID=454136 RepID=A0A1U7IPL8_9CYAN|nr:hypothetical protein [Phormidium ambiguum]OKH39353.1 hypothetical protein NIES2119_06325 [Phormidium ambiguum IAM M-71]